MAKTAPLQVFTADYLNAANCCSAGCDDCNSGELVIAPTCHPDDGVHVHYRKKDGVAFLECAGCGRPIAGIAVAGRAARTHRRAKKHRRTPGVPLTEFTYTNGAVQNGDWIPRRPGGTWLRAVYEGTLDPKKH